MIKKVLLGFASLALIGLSSLNANADINSFVGKKIVAVTAPGYEPYEFIDSKGNLVGLDIDLLNAICAELQAKCELKNTEFDSIISGIIYKKYDLAIAGIAITKERAKKIKYSKPYFSTSENSQYVALKSEVSKGFKNVKVVGAQLGTTQVTYLEEKTKYKVNKYPNVSASILDLEAKRVDAVLVDYNTIVEVVKKNDKLALLGDQISDPILGEGMAIVLNKKDKALEKAVNAALEKLEKEGKLQIIINKWIK